MGEFDMVEYVRGIVLGAVEKAKETPADDLVHRLRDHEIVAFNCADCYHRVMDEAADEIIALRERLRIRDGQIKALQEELRDTIRDMPWSEAAG